MDPISDATSTPISIPSLPQVSTPGKVDGAGNAGAQDAAQRAALQNARYQSGFDQPATDYSKINPAQSQPSMASRVGTYLGQVGRGYATGAANMVLDAANLANMGANGLLSAVGASYRFQTNMHIQAQSPAEQSAQNAIGVAAMVAPFIGEEGLLARAGSGVRSLTGAAGEEDAAAAAAKGVAREPWAPPGSAAAKVPEEWGAGVSNKKGIGTRWTDPKNEGNGIRIDKGDPTNPQPSQQVDHVVVRSGGKVLGRDGNPISGSVKDNFDQSHIPLSEWLKWSSWNHP